MRLAQILGVTIVLTSLGTMQGQARSTNAPLPFQLTFPLQGQSSETATINTIFDHHVVKPYQEDGVAVAFTGEVAEKHFGTSPISDDCYRASDGSSFSLRHQYNAAVCGGAEYLSYDDHPGYDFQAHGAVVVAAADGIVAVAVNDFADNVHTGADGKPCKCLGNYIRIDHSSGYQTFYAHLKHNSFDPVALLNQPVTAGTPIAVTDNTGTTTGEHLHFEVRLNKIPVDPYGWMGSGVDPYTAAVNIRLWTSQAQLPAPVISRIVPPSPVAGLTDQPITVQGSNFRCAELSIPDRCLGVEVTAGGQLVGTLRSPGQILAVAADGGSFQALATFGSPGTYSLVAVDPDGARSAPFIVTISAPQPMNQAPVAGFTMSAQGHVSINGATLNLLVPDSQPVSVTLSAPVCVGPGCSVDPDGQIVAWSWNVSGVLQQPAPQATVTTALGIGTHTINLTVTDDGGLTAPTTATVNVQQSGPTTVVTFDDLSGSGQLADGYGGINWQVLGNQWSHYDAVNPPYNPHSGAQRAFLPGAVAPGGPGEVAFAFPVSRTFIGAWFSGSTDWGETDVTFKLYKAGTLVHVSNQLSVNATPGFLSSGYIGLVDEVHIDSNRLGFFVMDDVEYAVGSSLLHQDADPDAYYGTPLIDAAGSIYVPRYVSRQACGFNWCELGLQKLEITGGGWLNRTDTPFGDQQAGLGLMFGPDGRVYFQGSRSTLFAYRPDGQTIPGWPVRITTQDNPRFTATFLDSDTGQVHLAAKSGFVADDPVTVTLNADGSEAWRLTGWADAGLTLRGPGGDVYVQGGNGYTDFVRRDRRTGVEICRSAPTAFQAVNPTFNLGTSQGVFGNYSFSFNQVYRFDGSCSLSLFYQPGPNIFSLGVAFNYDGGSLADARLIAAASDQSLPQPKPFFEGVDLSGVRVWRQDGIEAPPTGIKAIKDGVAYIVGIDPLDSKNKLFLLDIVTGQIKERIDVSSITNADFNVGVGPQGQVYATYLNRIYRVK